jgi:hypothetical protein
MQGSGARASSGGGPATNGSGGMLGTGGNESGGGGALGVGGTVGAGGNGGGCVGQCPFQGTPIALPGVIEAEDYDLGGSRIAYSDTTPGNIGLEYRNDDVDIKASAEGGYAVGWFDFNEWVEYTVEVAAAGTYELDVRIGSALAGRTFHVEFDGVDATGPVDVPLKGDWDQYDTVVVSGVQLNAGVQVMRFVLGPLEYVDVNWLEVK